MNTVRALFSMVANCNRPLYLLDVKNDFLHGDLQEKVYVSPPSALPMQVIGLWFVIYIVLFMASNSHLMLGYGFY